MSGCGSRSKATHQPIEDPQTWRPSRPHTAPRRPPPPPRPPQCSSSSSSPWSVGWEPCRGRQKPPQRRPRLKGEQTQLGCLEGTLCARNHPHLPPHPGPWSLREGVNWCGVRKMQGTLGSSRKSFWKNSLAIRQLRLIGWFWETHRQSGTRDVLSVLEIWKLSKIN